MISTIVLTPDSWRGDDPARAREIVARSLAWLVSAAVAGAVRDVTLAAPAALDLATLADHAGCALVEAPVEMERLKQAGISCRAPSVLVLKAGYQPALSLIEEIDLLVRRQPGDVRGLLLEEPATLLQRLFPHRAGVVGVLLPRADISGSFKRLARSTRRRGALLRARAQSID